MRLLLSLVALMRPHQWLKNTFVFAGLVFSGTWGNGPLALTVLNAFAAFCCFSSLVYILNDWHDREADARHPVKRARPLASGAVSPAAALTLAAALLALGVALAAGNFKLLLLLGLYLALNLAYSWRLKHVPVVDVTIIASGFMLRLLAGTLAVGIPPSRWLLLAGLFVALFLGFSKRKAETFHDEADQRAVLEHYSPALLDVFMAVTMTASLMTYGIFATSAEAQRQHGDRLLYTVPIVVFALLRYAYQVHRGRGEDVSRDLLRDAWILGALGAWLVVFLGHRF
ncbi:MAG: decaprenyl-phosphate phosphoribosyltransferase [Pseudomonadota bacterium]|uniref:decaprenyl-phosphate phosphoribosyltransferase n=1 Tax=Polaromonas sp. TaxID=1869339 RepID=UPI0017D9C2B3|nr:decaprenyl-phosphate phosphoribosyltransferase [Polaromonas sp.]MBA3593244.1 decaprenyl-phosphate phosphoribosyltransferase [Polaromonas sp.]MDQ3271658.1 decaprenyl-phosphate phosphoribosyltransferase [Pseudomonadota bacterium]